MNEKTLQRFKKLKALAERGVGGEKTTAQAMLEKLLAKNGIETLDELEIEEVEYFLFSYNGKHEIKLLKQCIYKVTGVAEQEYYRSHGTRQKIGVYCTKYGNARRYKKENQLCIVNLLYFAIAKNIDCTGTSKIILYRKRRLTAVSFKMEELKFVCVFILIYHENVSHINANCRHPRRQGKEDCREGEINVYEERGYTVDRK